MKEGRNIVRDYIKGKITYSEGIKRIFALGLDKKEKLKWFNNIRSIKEEFIEGYFYPANLHLKRLKSW